jgi:uncharacterized membrane protein
MSVDSNKNLAAIGALLIAIGSFTGVLTIVGAILLIIGLKGLADNYNDQSIYQNALYAIIFLIIGGVAGVAVFVLLFFGIGFSSLFYLGAGLLALGGFIAALAVVFVFYLLAAIYFRRTLTSLAQKTGENMFNTAGTLFFVGAILTIILVGLILVFIAWILATVAFFSMRSSGQQQMGAPLPPGPPPPPPPP